MKANRKYILVPFDFSDYSQKAGLLAFDLATKLNVEVIFFHAYTDNDLEASKLANDVTAFYNNEIQSGNLSNVIHSFILRKGVPEEEIRRFIKANNPIIIIMGTRGKDRKINDLIGSVTAEVMDISTVPVFAVPENIELTSFQDIKSIGYAISFNDFDLTAFASMMDFMKPFDFSIVFIHILELNESESKYQDKILLMQKNLKQQNPNIKFDFKFIPVEKSLPFALNECILENKIDVLAVKSNYRNIFSRIFVTGLAKKLIFHAKTPLFVLH